MSPTVLVVAAVVAGTEVEAQTSHTITTCGRVTENVRLGRNLSIDKGICLDVQASNVLIDGSGYQVSAPYLAISVLNRSNVTVENVVTSGTVQFYGSKASGGVVRDSTIGILQMYMGDDHVVENSTIGQLKIQGLNGDPAQRAVVRGNRFAATLWDGQQKLVRLTTGPDASSGCPRGDHLFTDNHLFVTLTPAADSAGEEPAILFYTCGTHSTIRNNVIESPKRARAFEIRDSADDNLFEANTISVGEVRSAAVLIHSGSPAWHHPRNNVFQGNVFRVRGGRATWLQAWDLRGNVFRENLFWTETGGTEVVRVHDGPNVDHLFDHNTFYHGGSGPLVIFRELGPGRMMFRSNIFAPRDPYFFDFDKLISYSGYHGDYNVIGKPQAAAALGVWRQYTGQDTHSVAGDPAFVDPASGDFHITDKSVARGAGENGTDAGAFEWEALEAP